MTDGRRIVFNRDARFAVAKADGKPVTLSGYAIVWNVLSDDRGGYKVRLKPGSATFAAPTLALFNHDFRQVLGTTGNGTLRLTPDEFGVRVEIDLPDTSTGRDVAELVGRKYVAGMSFAMVSAPVGATVTENGEKILDVTRFTADEVTVTPVPAFLQSNVGVKPESPESYAARAAQSLHLEKLKFAFLRLPSAGATS